MSLSAGTRFGVFEIVAKLGEGGMGEGMLQLEEGLASGSTASMMMPAAGDDVTAVAPKPVWRRALPIAVAVAVTAGAFVAISGWMDPPPSDPRTPIRFQHEIPASAPIWVSAEFRDLAVSPDGKSIVFAVQERGGSPSLWVRRMDQLDAARLRGAEGAGSPLKMACSSMPAAQVWLRRGC